MSTSGRPGGGAGPTFQQVVPCGVPGEPRPQCLCSHLLRRPPAAAAAHPRRPALATTAAAAHRPGRGSRLLAATVRPCPSGWGPNLCCCSQAEGGDDVGLDLSRTAAERRRASGDLAAAAAAPPARPQERPALGRRPRALGQPLDVRLRPRHAVRQREGLCAPPRNRIQPAHLARTKAPIWCGMGCRRGGAAHPGRLC